MDNREKQMKTYEYTKEKGQSYKHKSKNIPYYDAMMKQIYETRERTKKESQHT